MDIKDPQELIDHLDMHDKSMYNIVGDDLFFDDIDGAKREAKEGNMDRAQNRLSDAYSRAQYFLERQMDREGLKEEEVGKVDMIAAAIQKALNKHKGDESKTYQLQQARKAMNKGDLEKAEKIASRLAEKLASKKKANEQFITEELVNFIKNGQTLDEGFFDRLKAKVKGATAGIGQGLKNLGAAAKGDLGSLQSTAMASGMAKLGQKAKTLDKELNDVINDVNKLFPSAKLEKNPNLKNVIDQYKAALEKAKQTNANIASGKAADSSPSQSQEPVKDPKGVKTDKKVKVGGKDVEVFIDDKNQTYVKDDEGKVNYVTNDVLKQLKFDNYKSGSSSTPEKKSGPARDEKGRFVTNKKPDVKPELIDNNYEMTKKIYTYKGKNYQVQTDKKTKDQFFKHEDGRVMDIQAIERNSKVKKPAVKK